MTDRPGDPSGKRIVVLGGGAAGILAARSLAGAGGRVTLIEAGPRLGGLHASHRVKGCWYDIGTFVFNENHDYFRAFPELDRIFPLVDYAPVSLTPAGTLDRFPLSVRGYARSNGWASFARDLGDLALRKLTCRRRDSLVEYIHYYVGRRLYVRSGLRNYIERLFSLPDREIDREFARRRLETIAERCSLRRNSLRLVGRALGRRAGLVPRCRIRPPGGFDPVYRLVESSLRREGVEILTDTRPGAIRRAGEILRVEIGGEAREFDSVVSTIPMETTAGLLGVTLPLAPQYVQLVSLFYRFDGDPGFDSWCLYNLTPSGPWKRLTLFSRCYGRHDGEHYFTAECTLPGTAAPSVEALRQAFEEHVHRYPIFRGRLTLAGASVTARAYPVYRAGSADRLAASRRAIGEAGVSLFGRQGEFDYSHSDELGLRARQRAWALPDSTTAGRPATADRRRRAKGPAEP